MKNLILIAALALFTLGATTGCETVTESDPTRTVDNIVVSPNMWQRIPASGPTVEYMFADVDIHELTLDVLTNSDYKLFLKYLDGNNPVQEPLPLLSFDGVGDITSEFTTGGFRIVMRPYDHLPYYPTSDMLFRLLLIR